MECGYGLVAIAADGALANDSGRRLYYYLNEGGRTQPLHMTADTCIAEVIMTIRLGTGASRVAPRRCGWTEIGTIVQRQYVTVDRAKPMARRTRPV